MANEANPRVRGEHRHGARDHVRGSGDRVRAGERPDPTVRRPGRRLFRGGPDGNELLTTVTGAVLIVLLAALGLTIVAIGQLLWMHLFLGMLLIGPLALKLASTGYRFVRYYTQDPSYRRKGPPPQALRLLAPLVVAFTVGVFVTGIGLLIVGPSGREPLLLLHKATFIGWLAVTAIHVLGHLPEVLRLFRVDLKVSPESIAVRTLPRGTVHGAAPAGGSGRWLALASATVFGLVLAIVLIPEFGTWTHAIGLLHHDH